MMISAEAQAPPGRASIPLPSAADIRQIIAERVDILAGQKDSIGIVVGVVGPAGRRVVSYGHSSRGDMRPLDGDTIFEIGSVSKVFTALLFADLVQRGQVALADPVAKYLPAGKTVPERNGRAITFVDLATHTSGLPFMPDLLPAFNQPSPAKDSEQLWQFLARYHPARDIGTEWDYSNIGYWLLGETLATRAGMDYEKLLRTRIISPLKLRSTGISLSPDIKAKLAVGHNAILEPAPSSTSVSLYGDMPAAGGLVSSVNDLLTFLSVAMGLQPSPLAPSMTSMLSTRRPAGNDQQAPGWLIVSAGDDSLIVHEGFTWGFASYMAWDPKARTGAVVLSNQTASVSDIARHLLQPKFPLEQPKVAQHTKIAMDLAILDTYTGRYEAQGEGQFIIGREGDSLTIQLPVSWGLPKIVSVRRAGWTFLPPKSRSGSRFRPTLTGT